MKNLMKKTVMCIVAAALLISCMVPSAFAAESDDIVILYENDAHCELEGYSKLAALKNELLSEYTYVGVVSSGDYLQGGSLGSISKGEYVVRLMNLVGYDAIALGNHEFDYGLERLFELSEMLDTAPVCANFKKIGEGECFEPYTIVSYGDVKIAYVGITTPTTKDTTSFPTQFVDENKNPLYTFSENDLAEVVQENIDKARGEGADFVIALTHLGDTDEKFSAADVVAGISGLDAVLDAHSHSVIESDTLIDKDGEEVVYTSTGTKFANVGKLTISGDSITTELISLENYESTDAVLDECIAEIMAEYEVIGNKKLADCDFDLITHDADGNRIIRVKNTNLGNLISDAFRHVLGADIAYFNGGGIRSSISAGDITFNDILSVLPFNNTGVVIEVSGATVIEMLEVAVASWPQENANFPHASGITFSVDTTAEAGSRVYGVKVLDKESGEYKPLELDKMYKLASNNFILLECGDGMTMFEGARVVSDTGILDVEVLERYIVNDLGGVIGSEYSEADQRVRFTEGVIEDTPNAPTDPQTTNYPLIATVAAVPMLAVVVAVALVLKKRAHANSSGSAEK